MQYPKSTIDRILEIEKTIKKRRITIAQRVSNNLLSFFFVVEPLRHLSDMRELPRFD